MSEAKKAAFRALQEMAFDWVHGLMAILQAENVQEKAALRAPPQYIYGHIRSGALLLEPPTHQRL
jgi:hypothetical protein